MSDKLGKMITNVIEVEKNGVKVVIKQQYNKEINDINIDFSEHDKVFEDKIAKLEKENKSLNSYLVQREQDSTDMIMKLKQEKLDKNEKIAELTCENESLKQRIAELESENEQLKLDIDKMVTSRSEWIDRAVEWQQKCEKLESKETKKPTKCTTVIVAKEINGQTYVTLDDFMSVVNDLQAEIGT